MSILCSVHVSACKNVVLERKKLSVKKLKERYILQLKTCGDLWFGVVEGRDGGLEGVKVSHLHHMYREAVPLHDC